VAFTRFGVSLTWEFKTVHAGAQVVKYNKDDMNITDDDGESDHVLRLNGRAVYCTQEWPVDGTADCAPGTCRFGYTTTDSSYTSRSPCVFDVVDSQNNSGLKLECGDAAVDFRVAVKASGGQLRMYLYLTCVNTSKLVPMTAIMWELNVESIAGWRAAVATASISEISGTIRWGSADYESRGQHAITQFSTPKRAELVHTNITFGHCWRVAAADLPSKRIGIALYEKANFP
jgi:hypothetical protein